MKKDERCTIHKRVCPWSILLIITLVSVILSASFVEGFTHHHPTSTTTTQATVQSHPNPTKLRSNSFSLHANNNNNDDNDNETEVRPLFFLISHSLSFHIIYSSQRYNSFFFFSILILKNKTKTKNLILYMCVGGFCDTTS